jgi:hypothetical protein
MNNLLINILYWIEFITEFIIYNICINSFAEELVKDYWANNNEETKQKETRKGRKRGAAAPPPTPIKKETKKARTITPKKAKVARSKIDEEFDHDEDWESSVSGVETVTRDDKTGELLVYLKW